MGKKQYQSEGKYARQGSKPKKRRSQKPQSRPSSPSPTQAPTVSGSDAGPTPGTATPRPTTADAGQRAPLYSYVIPDLKRTALLAVIVFAILIVLSIVL